VPQRVVGGSTGRSRMQLIDGWRLARGVVKGVVRRVQGNRVYGDSGGRLLSVRKDLANRFGVRKENTLLSPL